MSNPMNTEGLRWLAGQLAWERRLAQLQENADFAQAIGQELPVRYVPAVEKVGAAA
jgi:hypothetical protein